MIILFSMENNLGTGTQVLALPNGKIRGLCYLALFFFLSLLRSLHLNPALLSYSSVSSYWASNPPHPITLGFPSLTHHHSHPQTLSFRLWVSFLPSPTQPPQPPTPTPLIHKRFSFIWKHKIVNRHLFRLQIRLITNTYIYKH